MKLSDYDVWDVYSIARKIENTMDKEIKERRMYNRAISEWTAAPVSLSFDVESNLLGLYRKLAEILEDAK